MPLAVWSHVRSIGAKALTAISDHVPPIYCWYVVVVLLYIIAEVTPVISNASLCVVVSTIGCSQGVVVPVNLIDLAITLSNVCVVPFLYELSAVLSAN